MLLLPHLTRVAVGPWENLIQNETSRTVSEPPYHKQLFGSEPAPMSGYRW